MRSVFRLLRTPVTGMSFMMVLHWIAINNIQAQSIGSWNIVNAKLTLDDRWSVWAEGQVRSTAFMNDFFYFETKGGATYELNDNISMTAGVGRYETYMQGGNFESPRTQGETRTWLQLIMENQLGRFNFDHRYRIEQRHITSGYRNRFRYRFNLLVPITNPDVRPGTIYSYIGDEIFFTDKAPFYERNRFFVGLGIKASQTFAVQAGYLRQYDYKIESQTSRNFIQLSLLFNMHIGEQGEHSVPKTTD